MAIVPPTSMGTNGRNGSHGESDSRKLIALMAVVGSISDARSVYLELAGSTLEGWDEIERSLTPLRRFVLDGEQPYVSLVPLSEYRGTPTPAGDCADDALPLGMRNQSRAAIRAMMAGDTYPEQQWSMEEETRVSYELS
jgi:hypothetical protein